MLLTFFEALDWTTFLISGAAFILTAVLMNVLQNKPRLPPQPGPALPLIGHLYKLEQDPRAQYKQWRKEYGDVFSFYLGTNLAVVLNGYSTIKEAFHTRGDEFSDRSLLYFDIASGIPSRGISTSNGEDWKEQRSCLLTFFRRLGVGKNPMAERIIEEALHLTRCLEALEGKPQNISGTLNISLSNVICSFLIGKRFEYTDKDFQTLIEHVTGFMTHMNGTNPLNVYPVLRHLPGDPFHGHDSEVHVRGIIEFAEQCCKVMGFDDNSYELEEPENIIACYIKEMNKKKKSGVSTFMDKNALLRITFDLFVAGTDTTSASIDWALLFVILRPEIQEKIFAEIEREVGTERLPTIHDRNKLLYLNAFIMEIQRIGNIVPQGLPHKNPEDVKFHGYDIPKGSYIFGNFDSVFSDTEIWGEDAESFRPERFIDANGQLIHKEEHIPFSVGKRNCIGESLAVMEIFIFLSILFQKFHFLPADEKKLPTTKSIYGIVMHPEPYELRAVRR